MSEALSISALLTASGSFIAILFRYIKKSDCFGVHIETRSEPQTPHIVISRPPSPSNNHKNNIESIYKEVEV